MAYGVERLEARLGKRREGPGPELRGLDLGFSEARDFLFIFIISSSDISKLDMIMKP